MRWMDNERLALVETFRNADPDSPTLCEGWNVRRLLAHLVMREHAPLNQLLDLAAKPEPGRELRLGALTATAESPEGYEALVARFAAGTGAANPMTWLGDSVQLVEYVIHHEDVRRGGNSIEPRVLPDGLLEALWKKLPMMAKMSYRRSPVGVTLATPGGAPKLVHKGPGGVLLSGDPVEVALYISGRQVASRVEATGTAENVEAFHHWAAGR
ncbi:TIGR03085 family protein [Arthrobacter livingstonensis]|uniref:TIGR03085 family protein n=1 Tax=Arthrobacter livingstonensis TaxID=670078 RepID=A0A2V5LDQ5_9MICC|nr:TIGR03085 family metal-binding protein [Arthrobacter livingstonensis]PYI67933.1 TIGR03085 family protein [Arthrobacter livingstonensis]